jgi:hypothetical protein
VAFLRPDDRDDPLAKLLPDEAVPAAEPTVHVAEGLQLIGHLIRSSGAQPLHRHLVGDRVGHRLFLMQGARGRATKPVPTP